MRYSLLVTPILVLASLTAGSSVGGAPPSEVAIDRFAYPNATAARGAWQAKEKAPAVTPASGGGLVFACPFEKKVDRAYWDSFDYPSESTIAGGSGGS